MKEFEIEGHEHEPFLEPHQIEDPESMREYMQKAAHAARVNEAIRTMWMESNANLLRIETFARGNVFETESAAFAKLLEKYLTDIDVHVIARMKCARTGYHSIHTDRIGKFNYQLSK